MTEAAGGAGAEAPQEAPLSAEALRALIGREGLHLREAEVEPVLATARDRRGAVKLVREAGQ